MKTTIERRIADLEQLVRGSFKVRTSTIACRVYDDAAQTLTVSGTVYAIAFAHERWDESNMHDTSTNNSRIIIPAAGWYVLYGNLSFAANNTGERGLWFRVDGSTYIGGTKMQSLTDASKFTTMSIANLYYLTSGQYVELIAQQISGGSLDTYVDANNPSEFAVAKVG